MKFIINLKFIFMPNYWYMAYPFCQYHDKAFRTLMHTHEITRVDFYKCYLGNTKIWIANFPYAIGIDEISGKNRPSRQTIYEFGKMLKRKKKEGFIIDGKSYYKRFVDSSF